VVVRYSLVFKNYSVVENNYLSEKEVKRKAVLERKEKAGTITPEEKQELADTRQSDKARDEAIKSVCSDGNKGSSSLGALVGPAQGTLKKYGEKVIYSLIYKDLYLIISARCGKSRRYSPGAGCGKHQS